MKKEVLIIVGVIFLISLLCEVYAIVGVSPPVYEVDFSPNLKERFMFTFIFDENAEAELYTEGNLAEYVTLSKSHIRGTESVVATLSLPANIETPGRNTIAVGAKQYAKNKGGVGIVGNVRGLIRVEVPYPGKYATVALSTTNVNAGDPVDLEVKISNLGKESIAAETSIRIEDKSGKYIETLVLGSKFIETQNSAFFSTKLDTINYGAGDYLATAVVNYGGKTAEAKRIFRLGELNVRIINHTKELERDKINKFDVDIESLWNDPIENVFANITIIGYPINTLTPSTNLGSWANARLTGFFDTSPIKENKFQAKIIFHYDGGTTTEVVELRFKKEGKFYSQGLMIGVIAGIVIIILVLIIIILLRRKKKSGTGKKKAG